MRKIYSLICVLAIILLSMSSCANSYSISGTSLQSVFDSKTAFLEYYKGEQLIKIDSCEIVHGKFSMCGALDSVMCVKLDIGGATMPVVLEEGKIIVSVKDDVMKVEGTPLNEIFYQFLLSRDSLTMQLAELPKKEAELILGGMNFDEVSVEMAENEAELRLALDKLETNFIVDNFDNVLGVTWFLELCDREYRHFGYPTTNPQIDEIYGRAPDTFRNNPSIKDYMDSVK
ncbi:MAG: DUF4369 domain-containing protein [Bacteroidaceae bacterium]|nr:DUF4369 domain-containing protein [Bacteroidaceae bacterium]